MCGDVVVSRPDLLVLVIALACAEHPDPFRNRLGRLVARMNVSLDSTNGAPSEPIADGHNSFRCETASLIACTEDPGEVRQLANDRRLDEPDRTPLATHTNDPVAPVLARSAGSRCLLFVPARKLAHGRRFAAGELVERIGGQHRRHLIGITHTKWTQHQTLGLDRRSNHLRTFAHRRSADGRDYVTRDLGLIDDEGVLRRLS